MGSIAVDKGIAKVGSPSDFYEQLEPDKIAEHILATSRSATSATWSSARWSASTRSCGATCRRRCARRCTSACSEQLPDIVHEVTDQIGDNIDQLLDVKLMVIRHIEAHPELANRIFLEVGRQGAALHHQLRLLLRLPARHPDDRADRALPLLVGAADRRHGRRLRHQLAGDLDDLRAGGAAEDRAVHAPRPVPAPPARGGRGLRGRDRRRHRDARATSATSCCTGRARTARAR